MVKKQAIKPQPSSKKAVPTERGAAQWNTPEPLHKERFEQLLDDAIAVKKKAS